MSLPPFKLASLHAAASGLYQPVLCCDPPAQETDAPPHPRGRLRLGDLDAHLHCSVIGTCLGTQDLRKLMTRFIEVQGAGDLEVHHEAVRLASQGGAPARALHKALEQRHEASVCRFARATEATALTLLWQEALRQGEVPGAYWAVLTHRATTPELRQRAFGDVHMLSHLVGAANRADIRRLVALEGHNTELHDRLERQQQRLQALLDERLQMEQQLQQQATELLQQRAQLERAEQQAARQADPAVDNERNAALLALYTQRREQAQQAAALAEAEAQRLREELAHHQQQAQVMVTELGAAETQLRELGSAAADPTAPAAGALHQALHQRRILYVGGRPSSAQAIRDLVLRHGGEIQRHDGGLEDRKGLLDAAVAWADLVVFPVDCVDHDSAGRLKRLCARQTKPFLPLRSASITSFVAALSNGSASGAAAGFAAAPICLKHG